MQSADQNCANCVYFRRLQDGGEEVHGECLRYPETVAKQVFEWCGEWKKQ
jgi:hypothetical protein